MTDGRKDWQSDWLTGLTHPLTDSLAHLINDWSWRYITDQLTVIKGQQVTPGPESLPTRGTYVGKRCSSIDSHDSKRFYDATNYVHRHQSFGSSPLLSSEWLTGLLNHWLTHPQTDSCQKNQYSVIAEWFTEWHTNWMAEWLTECLINRLTGLMTYCLLIFSRLFACHGLVDWLSERWWLADTCLLDRPTNRSNAWLRKRKGAKRSGSQGAQCANYFRQWSYCQYATLPFLNGVKCCNYSWCYQCCIFHVT